MHNPVLSNFFNIIMLILKILMYKIERDRLDYFPIFVLIIFSFPFFAFAQNVDSLRAPSVDSLSTFRWRPKILPELHQFDPNNVSGSLPLIVPQADNRLKYYNPENVMPKNFWEMDYRGTSYYTPRIVSDKLAHIMDRLPPESFVSLPAVALMAASIAMKYADIRLKIEIKATDYIIDQKLEPILFSLWKKSPQTAGQLYKSKEIHEKRTMEVLESDLESLIDHKVVKKRKMETEPDKYFAAQDMATVNQLIQKAMETDSLSVNQRQKLSAFSEKLKTLQSDAE